MYRLWMSSVHAGGMRQDASLHVFTPPFPMMSSPTPSVVNVPAIQDDAGPEQIDPATSTRMGSITYNQKNSYDIEFKSLAKFNHWLSHEQMAHGIEIQRYKVKRSRTGQLYLTCETYLYVRNGTGRKSHYMKKTAHERKINSKQIEGRCPYYVRIKMYPHTSTVMCKYNQDHSHPTRKDNLKYIRIQAFMQDQIESWVHFGVTDQKIIVIPSYILTDLIYNFQRKKIHQWFGKDERDYYMTMGEICRIRKEVLKADIQLDGNDAHSTQIWVNNLKSEGDFVYYKNKQDPLPEGSNLVDNLFILCIQTKFQKDAYE